MKKYFSLGLLITATACVASFSQITLAQPQLSGTPDELRGFLFPLANTVSINGAGELTAYKDLAKISLLVSTEARSLNQAMRNNQELRLNLIEEFRAAGIPDSDINNSKSPALHNLVCLGENQTVLKYQHEWKFL